MQIDLLIKRIEEKQNPTTIGLDTRLEYVPQSYVQKIKPQGVKNHYEASDVIYAYNQMLIDGLADIVPSVKVQVAYYEMYGTAGMEAFAKTCAYAKKAGLSVIADCKRSDIAATASAYATAYLGKTSYANQEEAAFPADFLTVNPYLGEDGIAPFLAECKKGGGGIFVLVKTSNPSSGQLQDLRYEDGRTLYEAVGDLVGTWGSDLIGERGYSSVGAVVGATYPAQGVALRKRLPNTFFLVPGYGAQGATAQDLAGCFDAKGEGALVNASRSILLAWQKAPSLTFVDAAREEALRMREALRAVKP